MAITFYCTFVRMLGTTYKKLPTVECKLDYLFNKLVVKFHFLWNISKRLDFLKTNCAIRKNGHFYIKNVYKFYL